MVDKVLALQNTTIEAVAERLGVKSVEVLSVLSQAEGGKFLINMDGKPYVLTFTNRGTGKIQLQKQLIDELALQGVQVSRITSNPAEFNGYTAYLSEYLEGPQPVYSSKVVAELTVVSARIAKIFYSLFPNTGARHDPRLIYNKLPSESMAELISADDLYLLGTDLESVVAQRLTTDAQCRTSYIHADIKAQNAVAGEQGLQLFDFDNLRKDVLVLDLAYLLEDYFLHIGHVDLAQIQQSISTFSEISQADVAETVFFPIYMQFAIIDKLLFALVQCSSGDNPHHRAILEKRLSLWRDGRSKLMLES